jgi:hypothetical protein
MGTKNQAASEQQSVEDDRLEIAYRLYHALRARFPDRTATLVDSFARTLSRSDQSVH